MAFSRRRGSYGRALRPRRLEGAPAVHSPLEGRRAPSLLTMEGLVKNDCYRLKLSARLAPGACARTQGLTLLLVSL